MMPEPDVKLFLRGEAAIYKEKPSEAEEIFRQFLNRETSVRTIAAFRLGEALYMMQKYHEALSLFRAGEKLGPEYIVQNPSALFYYADCLAREGDFEAGRRIMVRLIIGLSGTEHAPPLLVRLADMYRRAGRDKEALSIYRNITANFPATRAFNSARMRLYDRDFFSVNSVTCLTLIGKYRNVNASASDPVLQDESLFKAALLGALYRPAGEAVEAVAEYEKKYPYGIFSNVAKAIHEDLLVDLFHELKANNDCQGLLNMIGKNMKYLAKCFAEEGFVRFISRCYNDRGMARLEMTLFTQLVDSEWAAASAPFMYSRILDDAMALGEKSLAEGAARAFLRKYPKHELAWGVTARLGEICYMNGNMRDTVAVLSRLMEKGGRIDQPESLYYLGKAQECLHNQAGAEKAMALFVGELRKRGADSPFREDAFMVMAAARVAGGDKKGAMSMYRAGYATARGEFRDAFLFKMGDLSRQEGNCDAARDLWEKVVKEGSDSFWKKMASEELADLEWRAKWKFDGK
jgi:TolA-binding protein